MSFTNSAPVRARQALGAVMALAYLVEQADGSLGETELLAEATHIEVLLPDGTVGVDEIDKYPALHTQEVAYAAEVLALSIGVYRDPLYGSVVTFTRASAGRYLTGLVHDPLFEATVTYSRASAATYSTDPT